MFSIGLALAGIAQNQDIGVGLILGPTVEVSENVGAKLVPAQVEAMGIGLAGVIERIQVCHRTGGQHPLVQASKPVVSEGRYRKESVQLPQGQLVYVDFGAGQLHLHIGLQFPQPFRVRGFQLEKNSGVQKRASLHIRAFQKLYHVLQVALRLHGFLHIISACL